MDAEPTAPTTSSRRPSGSSARRGSASSSSRARSGAARIEPARPVEAELIALEPPEPVEEPTAEIPHTADAESDLDAVVADAVDDAESEVVEESEAADELIVDDEPAVEESTTVVDDQPETGVISTVMPSTEVALSVHALRKVYGQSVAVDSIDLEVQPGSFFGIVGPNGAGKTTTLGMVTGMLRPDSGVVRVFGLDVWANPVRAKRQIGVLPDRLRLFDRLTGAEFLYHAGALRGLDRPTIAQRSADLSAAFGLEHSLHRLVSDYSAGMTKKIAIAAAMIHAPRLLVLDEPFESVDPVSTSRVLDVLRRFTDAGGTVILSSHSMELTEQVCDHLAIIVKGAVLAAGATADVLEGRSLEERFVELAGGESAVEGMEWLQSFSD